MKSDRLEWWNMLDWINWSWKRRRQTKCSRQYWGTRSSRTYCWLGNVPRNTLPTATWTRSSATSLTYGTCTNYSRKISEARNEGFSESMTGVVGAEDQDRVAFAINRLSASFAFCPSLTLSMQMWWSLDPLLLGPWDRIKIDTLNWTFDL